jgi:glycerol-3-phosphate dehydrogenase (NAD(P)+)
VRLWAREDAIAQEINERHRNTVYLPGIELPGTLAAGSVLAASLEGADALIVAIPSQYCREVYRRVRAATPEGAVIVSATKGIEVESLMRDRSRQAAARSAAGRVSGPSFALEVCARQPTPWWSLRRSRDASRCSGRSRHGRSASTRATTWSAWSWPAQ